MHLFLFFIFAVLWGVSGCSRTEAPPADTPPVAATVVAGDALRDYEISRSVDVLLGTLMNQGEAWQALATLRQYEEPVKETPREPITGPFAAAESGRQVIERYDAAGIRVFLDQKRILKAEKISLDLAEKSLPIW